MSEASALPPQLPVTQGKMKEIRHKLPRRVLRWVGFSAAGLLFASVVLAASLPFLADASALRGALIARLSALSEAPVSITGAVRFGSFTGLSVEASGINLRAGPGNGPIRLTRAKSVKAVLRLSSLLRGKLDFEKFVIEEPHIVFRRGFSEPVQSSLGLGAAHLAFALLARSPFAEVELRDPVFFLAASADGPYERTALSRVRLKKSPLSFVSTGVFIANASGTDNALYILDITSPRFGASFRGQCAAACQTAFGTLRLNAVLNRGARKTILTALAPWERPGAFALSGELTLSSGRAALDNAVLSFGDHAAKGSLTLDMEGVRPRLEGTVAYDTLDLTGALAAASETPDGEPSLGRLPLVRQDAAHPLDFDLRLSADRFQAASFETGPLALAITRVQNSLSIDVASVALFGGHATASLDINPGEPDAISLRGSATRLDAKALANALQLPLDIGGPIALQAALTMPMTAKPPLEDLSAAEGTFSIRFPLGGAIEGDLGRTLDAALLEREPGWGLAPSSFSFAVASADGVVKPGRIDLKVRGQSGEKDIAGALGIAFPGAAVSGSLLASESFKTGGQGDTNLPAQAESSTKLFVSGTADAIIVSAASQPRLSN